jgi:heterodisulfide reductase subunit A
LPLQIDTAACGGCGACLAVCPTGAAHASDASDAALEATLEGMPIRDRLLVLTCNWGAYLNADQAGRLGQTLPPEARLIRLMCAGRVHSGLILKALGRGAAGVLVVGCPPEDECTYHAAEGGQARVMQAAQLAETLGMPPGCVGWAAPPVGDVEAFAQAVSAFAAQVMRGREVIHADRA